MRIKLLILPVLLILSHSLAAQSDTSYQRSRLSFKGALVNLNEINLGCFYRLNKYFEIGAEVGGIFPLGADKPDRERSFITFLALTRFQHRYGIAIRPMVKINSPQSGNFTTFEFEYLRMQTLKTIDDNGYFINCYDCGYTEYKEQHMGTGLGMRRYILVKNKFYWHFGAGFKTKEIRRKYSISTDSYFHKNDPDSATDKVNYMRRKVPYLSTGFHLFF